jgi:signal transduction histidine kinase
MAGEGPAVVDRKAHMQTLGLLGLGLAHELGGPLTLLGLGLDHLAEACARGDLSQVDALIERQRLLLTRSRGILDAFRRLVTHREGAACEVDAEDCLAAVWHLARPTAQAIGRSLTFTRSRRGAPAWVRADPLLLQQAIGCLIVNACDSARSHVEATVTRKVGQVVVEITDDGAGPPAGSTLGQSTKTGGMGVGLALVEELARRWGGHVALSQNEPTGTRAALCLPAAPTVEVVQAAPAAPTCKDSG